MANAAGIAILCGVTAVNMLIPLPLVCNLLVFTVVPIYVGSMRSRKLSPLWEADSVEVGEVNVIGSGEAMKFPFIAGGVLVGLYAAIKLLSPSLVNALISLYLLFIGAYCVKYYICLELHSRKIAAGGWKYSTKIRIPYFMPVAEELVIDTQDIIAIVAVSPLVIGYLLTKHWVISNVFGLALSVHALENMPVGNFKIAIGLLAGLLVYDVFFVFGTDVMLTVAKNIDGPIKLLFPKEAGGFSMIGLGDIIMPGILIAMALRYDLFRLHKNEKPGANLYFNSCIVGYAVGIVITLVAMSIMDKEQPALLYLVPTTVVAVLLCAVASKELSQLWLYKEENN